ncbi:MAG: hypothetical protein ABJD11_01600 [Gemmatimonadota bacterium]
MISNARLILTLLFLAPRLCAAQQAREGWHLSLAALHVRFSGAASDTLAIPGTTAHLQPQSRLSLDAAISRRSGAWEVSVAAGLSRGNLSAESPALRIVDRTSSANRYRASLALGHRVAALGAGELVASVAPTFDYWSMTGLSGRVAPGVEAALDLRLPLGRFELVNRLSFGMTSSPFHQDELPLTSSAQGLRAFSLGIGARYGLSH